MKAYFSFHRRLSFTESLPIELLIRASVWCIWRRKWWPLQYLPEKSHGQKSLAGYSPWSLKKSDTTWWLNKTTAWYIIYLIELSLILDHLQNATINSKIFFCICQVPPLNRTFITSDTRSHAIDFAVLFLPLGNTKINKSHRLSVGGWKVYLFKIVLLIFVCYII